MKKFVLLAATAAFASTGAAFADGHSATLADTVARGTLKCGVNLGVPGFAEQAADGSWSADPFLQHAHRELFSDGHRASDRQSDS